MDNAVRRGDWQHHGPRWIAQLILVAVVTACSTATDGDDRLVGDALNDTGKDACKGAGLAWVGGERGCLTPDEIHQWKTSACGNKAFYVCEAKGFPAYGRPVKNTSPGSVAGGSPTWTCYYDPTMDRDWHNDVLCTNGVAEDRPYLRSGDRYVTEAEIMESAREYERQLNSR